MVCWVWVMMMVFGLFFGLPRLSHMGEEREMANNTTQHYPFILSWIIKRRSYAASRLFYGTVVLP